MPLHQKSIWNKLSKKSKVTPKQPKQRTESDAWSPLSSKTETATRWWDQARTRRTCSIFKTSTILACGQSSAVKCRDSENEYSNEWNQKHCMDGTSLVQLCSNSASPIQKQSTQALFLASRTPGHTYARMSASALRTTQSTSTRKNLAPNSKTVSHPVMSYEPSIRNYWRNHSNNLKIRPLVITLTSTSTL